MSSYWKKKSKLYYFNALRNSFSLDYPHNMTSPTGRSALRQCVAFKVMNCLASQ